MGKGAQVVWVCSDCGNEASKGMLLLAAASSIRNMAADAATVVFGELGLAGELRAVGRADLRLKEAARMGFPRAVSPVSSLEGPPPQGRHAVAARSASEALFEVIGYSGEHQATGHADENQ